MGAIAWANAAHGLSNDVFRLFVRHGLAGCAPFPPFPPDLAFPELTFNVIISFELEE